MVLASLVMTIAMPTVTVAMARNQHSAQRRGLVQNRTQARTNAKKQPIKKTKRSLWNHIKDNWEYAALGGCALIGIAAVILWNLNQKGSGTKPNQKLNPLPNLKSKPNPVIKVDLNDPDLAIKENDCAVCFENTNDRTPCCNNPVCRPCWNTPVKGGDAEFVDENLGLRIQDKGKVLPKACPMCRKAHR